MLIAAARFLTCTVAALILGAGQTRADDAVLLYRATWGGLPAAQIRVIAHTGASAYRIEIAIASEGLPNVVTHFRATGIVDGRLIAGQPPLPTRFDANYDLRKRKDSKLRMSFITRGSAIVAERGPEAATASDESAQFGDQAGGTLRRRQRGQEGAGRVAGHHHR